MKLNYIIGGENMKIIDIDFNKMQGKYFRNNLDTYTWVIKKDGIYREFDDANIVDFYTLNVIANMKFVEQILVNNIFIDKYS